MTTATVRLPEKIVTLFGPLLGSYLYRVARGGRGSGKSVGAATMALLRGYERRIRVLCVRQFQNSIQESFYRELVDAMEQNPWLADQYIVTKESITGRNGTQFIFRGLDRNPQSIKSLAKIDLTIIEEAEDIPEASWINLEATVFRQPNSEMWVIYNPKRESTFDGGRWSGSPVDTRFIKNKAPRSIVMDISWRDNPFFPENLETLRQRDIEAFDYATYAWIWEGAYLKNSKAQIFHDKFEVKTFEPGKDWDGPYQGGDFGWTDPTAAIRCWIHDECLYIEYEAGGTSIDLDKIPSECSTKIPDWNNYTSRWDSANPASISLIVRYGMPRAIGVKKSPGSIEDGIAFIRSFRKVYIHPRCRQTLNEFNTYSWKIDRLSGDILDKPVDANNHYIDSLRYALEPMMRRGKVSYGWAV
jgi:phage terminase large subunit